MRGMLRVLLMSVVAIVMTGTAYLAGFGTSWLMDHEMSLTDAAQTVNVPGQQAPATDKPDNFDVFWEAWNIVEQEFYGDVPKGQELTYGAIRGVLDTLDDPNTLLIDPQAAELSRTDIQGEFEGIGAVVSMNEDGQLVVISPMDGQPAQEAGLQAGDIILQVDGTEITGMDLTEAVLLIRGPRGTTVKLTVVRPGTEGVLEYEIVRAKIETMTVAHRMLEDAPDIGYIRVSLFGERTTGELRNAITDLQDQGAKAFIVDIRNNPGGLLSAAVSVTSQFVNDATIVTEAWNNGDRQSFPAQRGGLLTDSQVPVVFLVNKGSASASEILAGAVQDLDRGTLVGEKTFGKGSVQHVYTLADQSQLNVTVAHWLTPDGTDINEDGILPDVVVTLTDEQIQAQQDVQLERGIEILQDKLATGS